MGEAIPQARRAVVTVGDVEDPACHGGIPHAFLSAARRSGFADRGGRVRLCDLRGARLRHAAGRLLRGRRPGGFQYSAAFLDRAEAALADDPAGNLLAGEVISFSQHFPRAESVRAAGGRISYYLDATAAGMLAGRGLDLRPPADVADRLRQTERENFARADRLVFRARWAAASAVDDCGADPAKVHVVLPGANLELPDDFSFNPSPGVPGADRPAVLGFVGKDWARRGCPCCATPGTSWTAAGCGPWCGRPGVPRRRWRSGRGWSSSGSSTSGPTRRHTRGSSPGATWAACSAPGRRWG